MRVNTATELIAQTERGKTLRLKGDEVHTQSCPKKLYQRFTDFFRKKENICRREAELARAMSAILRFDNTVATANLTIALPNRVSFMAPTPIEQLENARKECFRQCVRTALGARLTDSGAPNADLSNLLHPADVTMLTKTLPTLLATNTYIHKVPLTHMLRLARTLVDNLLADQGTLSLYNLYTDYHRPSARLGDLADYLSETLSVGLRSALFTERGFDRYGIYIPGLRDGASHLPTVDGQGTLDRIYQKRQVTGGTEEQRNEFALLSLLRTYGQSVPERNVLSYLLGDVMTNLVEQVLNGTGIPSELSTLNPFNPQDGRRVSPRLVAVRDGSPWCNIMRNEEGTLSFAFNIPVSAEGYVGSLFFRDRLCGPVTEHRLEAVPVAGESPVNLSGVMGRLSFMVTVPGDQFDGSSDWRPSVTAPDGYTGQVILVSDIDLHMQSLPPLRLRLEEHPAPPARRLRMGGEYEQLIEDDDDENASAGVSATASGGAAGGAAPPANGTQVDDEEKPSVWDRIEKVIFAPIFW